MEQIDIMPRREGSGIAGTRELLSVGQPLMAALALTPIGRGILGAVGTLAAAPMESEAGIFTNLGKLTPRAAARLTHDGMVVFPEKLLIHEIPTSHWTSTLNTETMASAIKNLKLGNIGNIPQRGQKVAMERLKDIKAADLVSIDERTAKAWDLSDSTNALYAHREPNYPKGMVGMRDSLKPNEFEASFVHEFTHLGDEAAPLTRQDFLEKTYKVSYDQRVTENKAFLAGSRSNFPTELTDPASEYFLHPMISYTDGKFSLTPLNNYVNALKAEGRDIDIDFLTDYVRQMQSETARLTMKAAQDPMFKATLDNAVKDVPLHYESWVFSEGQKKARGKARVEAFRAKKAAEAEARDKQIKEEFRAKVDARLEQLRKTPTKPSKEVKLPEDKFHSNGDFLTSAFRDPTPDKYGNRKFKSTIKLKDGGRLSGTTSDTVMYGYDKNGEQFTIGVDDYLNNIKKGVW